MPSFLTTKTLTNEDAAIFSTLSPTYWSLSRVFSYNYNCVQLKISPISFSGPQGTIVTDA